MNCMHTLRHWLMGIIAGDRFAYWISEKAEYMIGLVGDTGVLGGGAAICLVKAVDESGHDEAVFTLGKFTITVKRNEAAE